MAVHLLCAAVDRALLDRTLLDGASGALDDAGGALDDDGGGVA